MAYLITCAGSKRQPHDLNPSSLDNLSFTNILFQARERIIRLSGQNLDWNHTLPAWQLYSGNRSRMYPQIINQNWIKPSTEIKILSALFGWIKHTDLIPYYNLKMSDKIGSDNQTVWRLWNNLGILDQLIKETDIDLLSQDYRKAIHGSLKPVGLLPPIIFKGYGDQKGKWLNKELDKLN